MFGSKNTFNTNFSTPIALRIGKEVSSECIYIDFAQLSLTPNNRFLKKHTSFINDIKKSTVSTNSTSAVIEVIDLE